MDILAAVSALCGWVYTLCWSLSFYPQPLLNARRRSTAGTTVDFPFINCLGFLSYLLSTAALRYAPVVRAEYAARHHGLTPTVAANDVAFAAHALLLSLVTLSQYLLPRAWWGGRPHAGGGLLASPTNGDARNSHHARRPSRFIVGLAVGCVTGVCAVVLLVLRDGRAAGEALSGSGQALGEPGDPLFASQPAPAWQWLDAVYALGYVKLLVTLVKYSPQVLANWRNRSTAGWSIVQILLDFAGGLLSIAQLGLDSYRQRDWSGLTGNPVKLALGNVSMAYDVVFVVQHYVLYREGAKEEEEEEGGEGGEQRGIEGEGRDGGYAGGDDRGRPTRPTERQALLPRID